MEQKGCHNSEATVIFLRNDWSRAARFEEERARTDDSKTRNDFRIGGSQDMYCIKSLSLFCSRSRNANVKSSTTERQQVFHLFFLELVSVMSLSSSSPLALPSVQGVDRLPWASMPWKWRPSLLRAERLVWSSEPVLLHFFTGGGAREPGVSSDVSERLFSVSDKCSLFRLWRQPSPAAPVPVSSSEGSMESCRGQPGLVLPPPQLLWLLWCPLVAWRLKVVLRLFSKGWSSSPGACSLGCKVWLGRGQRSGMGRSRSRGGETLKLSPSSRVVCRLPSELPVAREESLWDGCCTQRREVFGKTMKRSN